MTPSSLEARFAPVREILRAAIAAGTTPGVQIAVRIRTHEGPWTAWDCAEGRLHYDPGAPAVSSDTLYDLASVTKCIVALACVRAAARGALDLHAPLSHYVPESAGFDPGTATLEALLSHRAELPAWQPFYQSVTAAQAEFGGTRESIVAAVARTAREPSGGAARYSDVGYILAGEALARGTRRPIEQAVREEVLGPVGIDTVVHYRGVTEAFRDPTIAPTERCAWRGCIVQGNVHDENAYALEGRSGHAGLFGTARAVVSVGEAALRALAGDDAWLPPEALREMVRPRPGGTHRLGWDGKAAEGSSAGTRMSPATFGHLGFTGTSLWCDPEAGVAVALMTNRVHPTRENIAIRALRPSVHDAVLAAIG